MSTEEQIQANIKNSQLGGVKTDEGKMISKYNAVKHGILTKVLSQTEKEAVENAYEQLCGEYQPETFTEQIQLQNASTWLVRLQRAIKAEQEYLLELADPLIVEERVIREGLHMTDLSETETKTIIVSPGYQAELNHEAIESLSGIYLRYVTTCERNLNRAIHELQRIQLVKKGHTVPPPSILDVSIDTLERPDKTDKIIEENEFV